MLRNPRFSVLLLLPLLAGCDAADAPTAAGAPLLAVTPELRIGSVDDPETALTWVSGLVVDDEGRIFSAHRQETVVLVHDAAGARLGRIGGPGEGPGEFRAVGGMGLRGDSLWVLDYRLYRITYFAPDGRVLRSVRVPIDLGTDRTHGPPRPAGVLADGRLFGSPPAWSRAVASGEISETPLVVMDTTGAAGDTLFMRPHTTWAVQDPSGFGGFGSYRSQPFADEALFALSPTDPAYVVVERAVRADDPAPAFRVARVGFDGDTAFVRSFPYEPVPIDAAVPDSLVSAWAVSFRESRFRGAPTEARAAEWARASLYVPAHHPPVTTLVAGRDGTTWLRREAADPDRAEWLVLDAGGAPIGRVELPAAFDLKAAERGRAWGTETDELDVPYIVRYGVGVGGGAG